MSKFWELLERSIVIQSTMALGLLAVVIYLYLSGQEVPSTLLEVLWVVIGFYFGSKVENAKTHTAVRNLQKKVGE